MTNKELADINYKVFGELQAARDELADLYEKLISISDRNQLADATAKIERAYVNCAIVGKELQLREQVRGRGSR